jgi:hypothetical protein
MPRPAVAEYPRRYAPWRWEPRGAKPAARPIIAVLLWPRRVCSSEQAMSITRSSSCLASCYLVGNSGIARLLGASALGSRALVRLRSSQGLEGECEMRVFFNFRDRGCFESDGRHIDTSDIDRARSHATRNTPLFCGVERGVGAQLTASMGYGKQCHIKT